MRKMNLILTAALILAIFLCTGASARNVDMGSSPEYRNTLDWLSVEPQNLGVQCCSFIGTVESGVHEFQNLNSRFSLSPGGRNVNMPQNFQPTYNNGRPQQLPSTVSREGNSGGMPPDMRARSFLDEQNITQQNTSYYQSCVTPYADAVTSYLEENDLDDKYEIYQAALSWTWVSDETLNGVDEKWLTPTEFLDETPAYSSNPDYGEPVSDCEEQANTLASLLIASGEYNESTVRVAIGKVDFGNVSGGHAWVEVYEDGEWFPLDPTEGPYYDDDNCSIVSADVSDIDYDEYLESTYPAVRVWYYFNDKYFMEVGKQNGDVPTFWDEQPESYPN
ncbi:transglutaminase domain-containing protein [Methanosarcina sp. DH1]|nr:transglutaminase domain-containing protein [Methanosarcina sp. DH1]